MRKKGFGIGVLLLCAMICYGCGGSASGTSKMNQNTNSVDAVLQSEMEKADSEQDLTKENSEVATTEEKKSEMVVPFADANVEGTTTEADSSEQAQEVDAAAAIENAVTDVDVDMTVMSSDMIYATVYQMMTEPDTYVGKTVRMKGNYTASWYDLTQQYYHYVVIQDATACCAQGLEFAMKDSNMKYPEDYPAEGEEVVVVGTFETYTEEGSDQIYCHLNNSVME